MSDESNAKSAKTTADKPPVARRSPDLHRFEIVVGAEVAGFTEYLDDGEQRIFFHTEIDEQFAGRGLASTLIEYALTETRNDGKRIVPICPFVAGYLKKHDGEFTEITDKVTPANLQAVKGRSEN